jgi:hypothetical protein
VKGARIEALSSQTMKPTLPMKRASSFSLSRCVSITPLSTRLIIHPSLAKNVRQDGILFCGMGMSCTNVTLVIIGFPS